MPRQAETVFYEYTSITLRAITLEFFGEIMAEFSRTVSLMKVVAVVFVIMSWPNLASFSISGKILSKVASVIISLHILKISP